MPTKLQVSELLDQLIAVHAAVVAGDIQAEPDAHAWLDGARAALQAAVTGQATSSVSSAIAL